MKTPLLPQSNAPCTISPLSLNAFLLFLFIVLFLHFYSYSFHIFSEKDVGAGLTPSFFDNHWIFSPMPDAMWIGKHFPGSRTALLASQHCNDQTPSCDDVCKDKMANKVISSSTCVNLYRIPKQCWTTIDIRCWGYDHSFWDGHMEWPIMSQDLVGHDIGVKWIHFQYTNVNDGTVPCNVHLVAFGDGDLISFEAIRSRFEISVRFRALVMTFMDVDMVMFTGHHMGAAWAAFMNIWFAEQGKPATRRISIGSSPPLATMSFHETYGRHLETSKMLVLGLQVQGKLIMDVQIVEPSEGPTDVDSFSLPQFGYACNFYDSGMTCMEPQPISFSRHITLQAASQAMTEESLLNMVSDIEAYMTCFKLCSHLFDWMGGEFIPNVYDLRPNLGIPLPVLTPQGPSHPTKRPSLAHTYSNTLAGPSMYSGEPIFAQPVPQTQSSIFASHLPPEQRQAIKHNTDATKFAAKAKLRPTAEHVMREMQPHPGESLSAYRHRIIDEVRERFKMLQVRISGNWHSRGWFIEDSRSIWEASRSGAIVPKL